MSADRDVVQGRKRVVGVANRPREISSDQARRQKAIFFKKNVKNRKNIDFCCKFWGALVTDMRPVPWQPLKTCHEAFLDINHVFTPQNNF